MKEIWKDIDGYKGKYQISNLGRVKSLKCNRERILKFTTMHKGYHAVSFDNYKNRKTFRVHRLVAQAFIPNPKNKPQVNHIDGNKLNNSINNLEWVSPAENIKHASDNNLLKGIKGELNYNSKLTREDVIYIRNSNLPQIRLAEKFNVHRITISDVIHKRTWAHITN